MRLMKWIGPLLLAVGVSLMLQGCAAPTVDTSTDESMRSSIQRVRDSLPEDRRAEFDAAIQTLMMSEIDLPEAFAAALAGKAPTADDIATGMKAALDGKTADEIITAADRVVAAREAKQREDALTEIAELSRERDEAAAARTELSKFEVLRARYSRSTDRLGMVEPRILLRVRNGTSHPVSRAYFLGVLASPGRSVPWLKEDFNYEIPGGVEPGEEATWRLAPNMFSAWGTVEVPPDAGLQVTVVRLDGADGESLFSAADYTEEDSARLAALIKEYR